MLFFIQIAIAISAAIIIFGVVWSLYGSLRTPVRTGQSCGVFTLITATGDADGLEQTLKGLVWLEKNGLVSTEIFIVDCGMDADGQTQARLLAKKYGNITLTQPEEVQRWIMRTNT